LARSVTLYIKLGCHDVMKGGVIWMCYLIIIIGILLFTTPVSKFLVSIWELIMDIIISLIAFLTVLLTLLIGFIIDGIHNMLLKLFKFKEDVL
jgi:hypothetical protein